MRAATAIVLTLAALVVADKATGSIYTVRSTDDLSDGSCTAGHCSLREAILAANAHAGSDTIRFAIGGAGPHTITPLTPLPTVTGTTIIDGASQPGYAGTPLVGISGATLSGQSGRGLVLYAPNCVVRGLQVGNCPSDGLMFYLGNGGTVTGCYVGVDFGGAVARPNLGSGVNVFVSSGCRIGGPEPADGNVIAANGGTEISTANVCLWGSSSNPLTCRDNIVQGNRIGTNAAGTAALGAQPRGVFLYYQSDALVGGHAPGEGNLVSGHQQCGIVAQGVGAEGIVIEGNLIGTNAAGDAALPNGAGIRLDYGATGCRIGGPLAGAGNLISGNTTEGIFCEGSDHTIQGNRIGTDATGTADLGNGRYGISFGNYGPSRNLVGGPAAGEGNVISGNGASGIYMLTTLEPSPAEDNTIQGNIIGADATGMVALPNAGDGIHMTGPMRTTIGGDVAGAGNVLSGNADSGLEINGLYNLMPAGTVVRGNLIGTDATGNAALPNGTHGVAVMNGARGIAFGGSGEGQANVVSGNAGCGLYFLTPDEYSYDIDILGNRIGTGLSGGALGNGSHGIHFDGFATQLAVGGTTPGEGNVIAHNGGAGVWIQNQYNFGVTVTGNDLHDNGGLGIDLGAAGVTANDDRDTDRGANETLNHPLIASARAGAHTLEATGTLNSVPYQALRLDFYASAAADPSGRGEGERFLGSWPVETDIMGNAAYVAVLPADATAGLQITATAVDSLGDTSEFSPAAPAAAATFAADLAVELGASPQPALVGLPLTLRAVTRQLGPDPASGVVLTATLPPALQFVSAIATRGTCRLEGSSVICEMGGLVAGDSVTADIAVLPQAAGSHDVTAAVTSREPDPAPVNDVAALSVAVVATADLDLAKTASRANVTPGMPFSYRLAVRNAGPSPATAVALVDSLPYGTTLSSLEFDPEQCDCTHTPGAWPRVNCTAATLAAGDSAVVVLNVSTDQWTQESNRARVSAATADPVVANNADEVLVGIVEYGATDLGLTMVDAPDPVVTGTNVVYSLELTNHGPSAAPYVQVVSYLPAGATFVTATASLGSWSYQSMARRVSFGIELLPLDATAQLTITLRADTPQRFQLSATASLYDSGDIWPADNTAAQETWFKPPPTRVVNSADDANDGSCDGAHCSLREAIAAANAGPGRDIIGFAIPGAGPHVIPLAGAALRVEAPAVIDGTYQPGWAGTPVIELDGSGLDPLQGAYGLLVAADSCEVRGLSVGNCPGEGVYAYDCDHFDAFGNHVGIDPAGAQARPNAKDGILLFLVRHARIGGVHAHDGNLLSGNGTDLQAGVSVRGLEADSSRTSDIAIVGNRIGTDATGTAAVPNASGVSLAHVSQVAVGGAGAGEGNLVSGNAGDGIRVQGPHCAGITVRGNRVGTDASGSAALGNGEVGVRLEYGTQGVQIGGAATGEGNVVSGNGRGGIVVDAHDCVVEGNLVGTDATGLAAVPNGVVGIGLLSYAPHDNRVGGAAPGARNVISGNAGYGVWIAGGETLDNAILGNYIGTDATGAQALPNAYSGVLLQEASLQRIGGAAAGEGNVISGNGHDGVVLAGFYDIQTGNRVQGNRIGTDASGLVAVPNGYAGVRIHDGARRALIGGAAPGEGNLISGNAQSGIVFWTSQEYLAWNEIKGNVIGLDAAGSPLPNGGHGVHFAGYAIDGRVGGLAPGEGNTIAHNHGDGVSIEERWVFDVEIAGNAIYDNDGLAIDAMNDGPTPPDDRDSDRGWDELQNFPALATAVMRADSVQVSGTLASGLGQTYRVDLYGSLACDPSGYGEARWYVGSIEGVATDPVLGHAAFAAKFVLPAPELAVLSATAVDSAGNTSELGACVAIQPSTAVDGPPTPLAFRLHDAAPNPFNPFTTLRFDLPRAGKVDLCLYDLAGRRVRTLARETPMTPGAHAVTWDGRDDAGRPAPSGVYFVELRAPGGQATSKVMLVK